MTEPRLRRRAYRFQIGQTVRLRGHAIQAVILRRLRSKAGREYYDVTLTGDTAGRPFRTFVGDGLEAFENGRETRSDAAPLRQAGWPLLLLPQVLAA